MQIRQLVHTKQEHHHCDWNSRLSSSLLTKDLEVQWGAIKFCCCCCFFFVVVVVVDVIVIVIFIIIIVAVLLDPQRKLPTGPQSPAQLLSFPNTHRGTEIEVI